MKINMPIGARISVKYSDTNNDGIIIGKLTNIFNGFVDPNLDYDEEAVAGIFVEKWIENGRELKIERDVNDKINIYRPDIIKELDAI